jgi:CubicO group peptidase (beta-lactamase class C family)
MDINGFVSAGFERVRDAFAQNFAEGLEHGAAFAAVINGEPVVNIWAGHADRARTKPWAEDTLVPVHSTTKPIAALIVARLVDEGLLDFDAPLSFVWPEFGQHGKDQVTLAQALSHQAGVAGFLERIDPDLWLDPPVLASMLADMTPLWPPGTACGYHAMTYGYLAGEAVRRVSARSLGTILREDICAPLGIDFWIGLPESEHGRCADQLLPSALPDLGVVTDIRRAVLLAPWSAPRRIDATWRSIELPSANGHGTALAVARLFGAFANTGNIGDMSTLSPGAFSELTAQRINADDLVLPFRMDWAAGVMRNNNKIYGPNSGTYAHAGRGGSFGLGDPLHGLSAGYVMNKLAPALQTDARGQRLITALYACV